MEIFDLEKELVDVAKRIHREIVESSHTESLMLVYKCLKEGDRSYVEDVFKILDQMSCIVRELDKEDRDLAKELVQAFVDDIEDVLESRAKKELSKLFEEVHGDSKEEDEPANPANKKDEELEKLEEEVEKLKDYFKRIGIEADISIEEGDAND